MTKKNKKQFKRVANLAHKISLNSKLVTWRNRENVIRHALSERLFRSMLQKQSNYLLASAQEEEELEDDRGGLDAMNLKLLTTFNHLGPQSHPKSFCFITGRGRSFQRRINFSRHVVRMLVRFGMLPGMTKERC